MRLRVMFYASVLAIFTGHGAIKNLRAEITQLSIVVDGLACPFCAYGLEKKLKNVPGVGEVLFDLKKGLATLVLEKGKTPEIQEIPKAVKNAGFTPRVIRLTAIGNLSINEEKVFLIVRDSDQKFFVFSEDRETEKLLTQLAKEEAGVSVTGSIHEHAESPPGLSTERVERFNPLVK